MTGRRALARLLPLALLVAAPAPGQPVERLVVIAAAPPPGPDAELAELTHQLRAAFAERSGGVVGAPEMRGRLAGAPPEATLAELDRAFSGALAVYQSGEFESAVRTLQAIVEDLERLPESEAAHQQWTRAMLRLSHAILTLRRPEEADAVETRVLELAPDLALDPVLYAPGFRAHFEELRARVRARPTHRLTVLARGRAGAVFVGGRPAGRAPVTLSLPAGRYRVGGAIGELRAPGITVDLAAEDRTVTLDFALAEAVRQASGPGLALAGPELPALLVRTGAWLGADRLVAVSRARRGEAQFLVGAIHDVRRGALLREGSVRLLPDGVPAASLGALASFLLTGQSSREVIDWSRDLPVAAGHPAPPRQPNDRRRPPPPGGATAGGAAAVGAASPAVPAPIPAAVAAPPSALASRAPPGPAPPVGAPATIASRPSARGPSALVALAERSTGTSAEAVPAVRSTGTSRASVPRAVGLPAAAPAGDEERDDGDGEAEEPDAAAPEGEEAPAGGRARAPEHGTARAAGEAAERAGVGGGRPAGSVGPAGAERTAPALVALAALAAEGIAAAPRPGEGAAAELPPAAQGGRGLPDLRPAPIAESGAPLGVGASAASAGRPAAWLRPAAIGGGVLAALLGVAAAQQAASASRASRDAAAMYGAGGLLVPGSDPARYRALLARSDAEGRNAWIAGTAAVASAAAAGILGWLSRDRPDP